MTLQEYLIIEREHLGGTQKVFRFPNNYGASVVDAKMLHMYPFYVEVGVIEFSSEDNEDYHLTYETPITNDVEILGDIKELTEVLERIKQL